MQSAYSPPILFDDEYCAHRTDLFLTTAAAATPLEPFHTSNLSVKYPDIARYSRQFKSLTWPGNHIKKSCNLWSCGIILLIYPSALGNVKKIMGKYANNSWVDPFSLLCCCSHFEGETFRRAACRCPNHLAAAALLSLELSDDFAPLLNCWVCRLAWNSKFDILDGKSGIYMFDGICFPILSLESFAALSFM